MAGFDRASMLGGGVLLAIWLSGFTSGWSPGAMLYSLGVSLPIFVAFTDQAFSSKARLQGVFREDGFEWQPSGRILKWKTCVRVLYRPEELRVEGPNAEVVHFDLIQIKPAHWISLRDWLIGRFEPATVSRMSSAHYGLEKRVHLLANISSLLPIPIWAYVLRSFRSEHIEVARAIGLEFSTGEIFFVGHLCVWFMHRRDRAFYAVLVSTGVTVGTF